MSASPPRADGVETLKTTVLLVDDDPQDLERWSQALTAYWDGYSVIQATEVQSAPPSANHKS